MIITTLRDGLGNQLFQYAAGRYLARKHKTKLKLDLTQCNAATNSHHAFYRLNNFNIQEIVATEAEIQSLPTVKNANPWIFEPNILNSPDNIRLDGFWQSEKYFSEIADILRKEFTLKNPLGKNSSAWKKEILSSKCAVSVHIRHGDFITYYARNTIGLLPLHHYAACVEELKKTFSDITLFVFSDDLQWCKENFKVNAPTKFVEGCENDFEEMYLMSLCKHNILSRGTFSWWGAWLNSNPDKKVFAPYPWQRCINYNSDIVPESWIKVPSNYPLWTPPMLSIIIYVENNFQTVGITLQTVIAQVFPDYEIILVDSSTDDSGKVCRQFAMNDKVTILKANSSTGKFSAWNKALEVARGDYVWFLTAKDFIFTHGTLTFSRVCETVIKLQYNSRENYVTYENYTECMPNLICAIQILTEDESGNVNINGIPNKKFLAQVDASFQGLQGLANLAIPTGQKLTSLAAQTINPLVSTKFFKREYLNSNRIRFNENEDVDSELTFVVETFLKTKNITFIPAVFYGRFK